jgi:hypothetical protein
VNYYKPNFKTSLEYDGTAHFCKFCTARQHWSMDPILIQLQSVSSSNFVSPIGSLDPLYPEKIPHAYKQCTDHLEGLSKHEYNYKTNGRRDAGRQKKRRSGIVN